MQFHVPHYLEFLSIPLLEKLEQESEPVPSIPSLKVAKGLREEFPHIETTQALSLIVRIYQQIHPYLHRILERRSIDRAFIDQQTLECNIRNQGVLYSDPAYDTVIGKKNEDGQIIVGPTHPESFSTVSVPSFMQGEQVTLFGPPDTVKLSINAMNTLHRKLPDEPMIVETLVSESGQVPRWGADNEDSKTPIMRNFLRACTNLMGCFEKTLSLDTERKRYRLAGDGLAKPIKRIPGLALPDGNHLFQGNPLPLHLVDFVFHLYHAWSNPQALCFYVPKLETEEEAQYLRYLIETAEREIQLLFPTYQTGSVRLFIVFENPRAIFRINEIAQALFPYFLGGSLGWHDFLASTARIFRNDPNYRIPVKADPNIVINHIRESHQILVDKLGPIGAIKIGGMYGTLFEDGNPASFELCMVGYIKDVISQLKRGLDGFWVAHPSFVRIGIALVEAWRRYERDPSEGSLQQLVFSLIPTKVERDQLWRFIIGADVEGLSDSDPLYLRGVLAADLAESTLIANHDPQEIRYNIFQALQYLADWLCGNGCVALPAQLRNQSGESVFVRIMDDLATTERSRWELWAEVYHKRVSVDDFERLLQEEVRFIRENRVSETKRVQVQWEGEAERWYPIAVDILRQLVCDPEPVEFVPQLLLPFTFDVVRNSSDPFALVKSLCPNRYRSYA